MKTNSNSSNSGGIGFAGLLTILFIGLKLTGHITWSWWWVLSPLWIGFALVLVFIAIVMVIAFVSGRPARR
jgi:uncharacterized protein (DUF983 family)